MKKAGLVLRLPLLALLSSAMVLGADLSVYRGFQLGMSLSEAVRHSGMDPSEVTLLQQRPALLQELVWNPERFSGSTGPADPVQQVLFSFFNGQLSRMAIDYDNDRTEGLSVRDMMEALSGQYGPGARSTGDKFLPSESFTEGVKVMAHWENRDASVSLVQSPYGRRFGLIVFSRRLDALARSAVVSSAHLDEQEAPQRQKADQQNAQIKLDKARLVNRQNFRP